MLFLIHVILRMGGPDETVVEVSDGFLKERQKRRARHLRAQGLNFTQIAEAMGTTLPHTCAAGGAPM